MKLVFLVQVKIVKPALKCLFRNSTTFVLLLKLIIQKLKSDNLFKYQNLEFLFFSFWKKIYYLSSKLVQ